MGRKEATIKKSIARLLVSIENCLRIYTRHYVTRSIFTNSHPSNIKHQLVKDAYRYLRRN